jgi:hypothetical protein
MKCLGFIASRLGASLLDMRCHRGRFLLSKVQGYSAHKKPQPPYMMARSLFISRPIHPRGQTDGSGYLLPRHGALTGPHRWEWGGRIPPIRLGGTQLRGGGGRAVLRTGSDTAGRISPIKGGMRPGGSLR